MSTHDAGTPPEPTEERFRRTYKRQLAHSHVYLSRDIRDQTWKLSFLLPAVIITVDLADDDLEELMGLLNEAGIPF